MELVPCVIFLRTKFCCVFLLRREPSPQWHDIRVLVFCPTSHHCDTFPMWWAATVTWPLCDMSLKWQTCMDADKQKLHRHHTCSLGQCAWSIHTSTTVSAHYPLHTASSLVYRSHSEDCAEYELYQEVVEICDLVAKWLKSFHVTSTKRFST